MSGLQDSVGSAGQLIQRAIHERCDKIIASQESQIKELQQQLTIQEIKLETKIKNQQQAYEVKIERIIKEHEVKLVMQEQGLTKMYENMFQHLYELSKLGQATQMKNWLDEHSGSSVIRNSAPGTPKNQSNIKILSDDEEMPVFAFDFKAASNLVEDREEVALVKQETKITGERPMCQK